MPYRLIWFDPPTNMSIPVIPGDENHPPDGYDLRTFNFSGTNEAHIHLPDDPEELKRLADNPAFEGNPISYYYCQHCQGWIAGIPNSYHEDTLAPLAGRRGEVYHCVRCGVEVGFFGMVS